MDTPLAHRPGSDPIPDSGDERWLDWLVAHGKPRPGWERHTVALMLFDPAPPAEPRPELLLNNLVEGDVLPLERVDVPGRARPDFIVRTQRGRDLGLLPPNAAGMVEGLRLDGLEAEVSVFAAVPQFPAETALMLELDVVVWCHPADWVERPTVFNFPREA